MEAIVIQIMEGRSKVEESIPPSFVSVILAVYVTAQTTRYVINLDYHESCS